MVYTGVSSCITLPMFWDFLMFFVFFSADAWVILLSLWSSWNNVNKSIILRRWTMKTFRWFMLIPSVINTIMVTIRKRFPHVQFFTSIHPRCNANLLLGGHSRCEIQITLIHHISHLVVSSSETTLLFHPSASVHQPFFHYKLKGYWCMFKLRMDFSHFPACWMVVERLFYHFCWYCFQH